MKLNLNSTFSGDDMSTFVVFGMTISKAKVLAEKLQWKSGETPDDRVARVLSGKSVKPPSDPFDAPQFATEFLELARKTDGGVRLEVRYRKEIGTTKSGKPRMKWVRYEAT